MNWIDAIWCAVGATLGVLHAHGIWRSTTHIGMTVAVCGLLRLTFVAAVLTASAVLGGLIPTAVAWGVGFFAVVTTAGIRSGALAHQRPCGSGRNSP